MGARAIQQWHVEPRLMTREQAAGYCQLSPQGFSDWVKSGRLPDALPGTHRWDRKALDAALDRLSGIEAQSEGSPFDQWKRSRNARAS